MMIFDNFFYNNIKYMNYGDNKNGLVFAMVEDSDTTFTLKITVEEKVKLLLISRENTEYKIIMMDGFDESWNINEIVDFVQEKIEYYVMTQTPNQVV